MLGTIDALQILFKMRRKKNKYRVNEKNYHSCHLNPNNKHPIKHQGSEQSGSSTSPLCNHHSEVSNLHTSILYRSVFEKLQFSPDLLHSHSTRSLDILTEGQLLDAPNLRHT